MLHLPCSSRDLSPTTSCPCLLCQSTSCPVRQCPPLPALGISS